MTQKKKVLVKPELHTDPRGPPPEYSVRVSARARHVHLKLSRRGELEVVVPRGYNRRRIPEVLAAKRAWLERARARVARQMEGLPAEYFELRPERVRLQAIGKAYAVSYRELAAARVAVDETAEALYVRGPITTPGACAQALRTWLRAKALQTLAPSLRRTGAQLKLPYAKLIVRSQRSRWGSCSSRGVISLNCKLLFLPPAQVHYLFVHELCHTRHLNHSARFWALVERKLPGYREQETALRNAWRHVPWWAGD